MAEHLNLTFSSDTEIAAFGIRLRLKLEGVACRNRASNAANGPLINNLFDLMIRGSALP